MVREIWVQSQVTSYQRLKKWYLIHPCLTLCNIRYVSRVKWRNPEKGVISFPTPIEKGAFLSHSTTVANFALLYIYIYIYNIENRIIYIAIFFVFAIYIYIYIYIYAAYPFIAIAPMSNLTRSGST